MEISKIGHVGDKLHLPLLTDNLDMKCHLICHVRGNYVAVNVFPDPPHRGAAWGLPRGLSGVLLFVQTPGVWGFSQVLSLGWIHGICLY